MNKVKTIRNEAIKSEYRYGLGEVLARKYGISRTRVHQILKIPDPIIPQTTQNPFLARFRRLYDRLYFWLKRWVCYPKANDEA